MNEEMERRLRAAREGLRGTAPGSMEEAERRLRSALPAASRRRRRRRTGALVVALALVAVGSAFGAAAGGLFDDDPPPEVRRAFLLVSGEPAPNRPLGPSSGAHPPATVAARLVVADTPWGRYTLWRGLDASGQVSDLVQDPSDGFGGGSLCAAFDPVIPPDPAGSVRIEVPDVRGLGVRQARARLGPAGFRVVGPAGPQRGGVVIFTVPEPGARPFVGSTVSISTGSRATLRRLRAEILRAPRPAPPAGDVQICGEQTADPGRTPTVMSGAVSAAVATAEIEYADGRRMPAFVSNRALLVVVPPQTCGFGLEPPRALVLRDGDGGEIDRVALGRRRFDLGTWEANGPPICGKPIDPSARVAGSFAVLRRPESADDALPLVLRRSGMQHMRPATARLAARIAGRRLWVAEARPFPAFPDGVCLIDLQDKARLKSRAGGASFQSGPGGVGGITCPPSPVLQRSFLLTVLELNGRRTTIAGLVPDGYAQVRAGAQTMPIDGNVFLLRDIEIGTKVVVAGPAGERSVLLGGQTGVLQPPDRQILTGHIMP